MHRHHMFFERSRDDACVCRLQLREKREELNKSIAADEEEKGTRTPPLQLRCFYSADGTLTVCCRHRAPAAKIQNDLRILTERLARINDNLARKVSSRTEYDKTITEVRSALLLLRHVVILRQLPLTCCCFCCYACVLHRRRPPTRRSWSRRRRCCTCSSASRSTSRKRSRRRMAFELLAARGVLSMWGWVCGGWDARLFVQPSSWQLQLKARGLNVCANLVESDRGVPLFSTLRKCP